MKLMLNKKGVLRIVDDRGMTLIDRIDSEMRYPGTMYDTLYIKRSGAWTLMNDGELTVAQCENVKMEFKPYGRGMVVRTHFTNNTGHRIDALGELVMIEGLWKAPFVKYVFNGLMNLNGNVTNDMRTCTTTWQPMSGQNADGGDFVLTLDDRGQHAVFGFASYERYFNEIRVSGEGYFNARPLMESHPFEPGETITTDWFYMGLCDDFIHGAPEFIDLTASFMQVKLRDVESPAGYCTWYYYLSNISQDIVYENLEFFKKNKEKLPIKYFQIDEGWNTGWGDWVENERFSVGMKKIADDIREAGFLPGIWIAPFGITKNAKIWKEHPAWFVKHWDSDEIWQEESLDMTHPEVKQYIRDLFHRLSYEWGFRYIKIDIVIDRAAPGRHYDPKATALMNIREGFRLMRESVTEDTFILACTSPLAPLAGLCDSMRTSGDVFESWEAARCLFVSNINRYFYHKRYFINDFDCLLVREKEEEDAQCGRKIIRNFEEVKCYLTAIASSGGTLMLSDKMTLLSEEKIDLLSKLFPINTEAAVPLDFTEAFIPGVLDFGYRGNIRIVALINWEEKGREFSFDTERGYAFEFWSGTYLGHCGDRITRYIEPHHCEIIFVTKEAPMAIIGADDCLCPTIRQTYENGMLTASFIKKGETLYLAAERPISKISGCDWEIVSDADGYFYKLKQTEKMDFTVKQNISL